MFEELRIGSKIKINWESDRVTERETNKKRKEKDGKKYTKKKRETKRKRTTSVRQLPDFSN